MSLTELNEKEPVGFKCTPVKVSEGKWSVSNKNMPYYNDDGVSLDTEGKRNSYQIDIDNFSSTVKGRITIKVTQIDKAEEKKDEPGCSAVNQGDYLGEITLLNSSGIAYPSLPLAAAYKLKDGSYRYSESVVSFNKETGSFKIAAMSEPICLSTLDSIILIHPI